MAQSQPIAASSPAPDGPLIPTRVWAGVLAALVMLVAGLEVVLSSGVVWRMPLAQLLQNPGDRHTRAVWLIHRPPPPTTPELIVLGSSVAAAITELPRNETEQWLRTRLAVPELQLVSLTVSRGCYGEHLTLFQNAIEQGHRPKAVLLVSWPACLNDASEADAVEARRMPLTSTWLAEVESNGRTTPLTLWTSVLRSMAVPRYRYTINAWVRSRWRGVLRGRSPLAPIVFAGDRRVTAWEGPFENDRDRYQRLVALPSRMRSDGRGMRILDRLLAAVREHGATPVIVEAPWAPPAHDILRDVRDQYFNAMQAAAARHGGIYVDPNRQVQLRRELFNDLYHVNHEGARAYLPFAAGALRPVIASR